METPPQEKSEQELCTMRIMFPVESDEQAIGVKKKIKECLKDIPNSHIQFSLMPSIPKPTGS